MQQQNRVPPMHPGMLRDEMPAVNPSTSIFRPWETNSSTDHVNKNELEKQDLVCNQSDSSDHAQDLRQDIKTDGLRWLQPRTSSVSVPASSFSPTIVVSTPYSSPPLQLSPPSANSTPGNQSNDSAYHSDSSTPSPVAKPATPTKGTRLFSADVIRILDHWYHQHFDHPYPTLHDVHELARKCNLRPDQVRKWLANKRNRSHNTLTYNGNVHPKSAKKLQQKQHKPDVLPSPYQYRATMPSAPQSYPWVQVPFPVPGYPMQHRNIASPYISNQLSGLTYNQQLHHQNYINQLVLAKPLQQNVEPFIL